MDRGRTEAGDPFESPLQIAIYRRLRNLVSQMTADLYYDSCEIRRSSGRLRTTVLIISHLFRELESALRDAIAERPPKQKGDSGSDHYRHLTVVLEALGLEPDDPRTELWRRLTDYENPQHLARNAHRPGLSDSRQLDEAFAALHRDFDALLAYVLDRLEASTLDVAKRLETLLSNPIPSSTDVDRLRNFFPNAPLVFERLFSDDLSEAWLQALLDHGFFQNPPSAAIPPAARFAAKVVSRDSGRAKAILETLPAIPNVFVAHSYMEVALRLPPGQAVAIIPHLHTWITTATFGNLEQALYPRFQQFIVHLGSSEGTVDDALRFLLPLIALQKPVKDARALFREPESILKKAGFMSVLEGAIPAIGPKRPRQLVTELIRLLAVAISAEVSGSSGRTAEDLSSAWRPAITFDKNDAIGGFRNPLTTFVRDALRLAREAGVPLPELLELLQAQRYSIFRRLRLDLMLASTAAAEPYAASELLNPIHYSRFGHDQEFFDFLRQNFAILSDEQKQAVEALILAGPPAFPEHFSNEERGAIGARWKCAYLVVIQEHLSANASDELDRIVQSTVSLEGLATTLPPQAYAFGPESPWTREQFDAMDVTAILAALHGWEPPPSQIGILPDEWGPALTLRDTIEGTPSRFMNQLGAFAALPPPYAHNVAEGLERAFRGGEDLDWGQVIVFAEAVVARGADPEPVPEGHAGWSQARTRLNLLMTAGMQSDERRIPGDLAHRVLEMLAVTAEDPNPTALSTEAAVSSALTRSHQDTRATSARALMCFLGWLRTEPTASQLDETTRSDLVSRSQQHLERLADDPIDSIRSVYGEHYTWLHRFDAPWTAAISLRVFPEAKTATEADLTAWFVFVLVNHPTRQIYPGLAARYECAATTWPVPGEFDGNPDFSYADKLYEHLLALYWHGKIPIVGTMDGFAARMSDDTAAHGMFYLGRSLEENAAQPVDVLDRLKQFWQWRREVIDSDIGAHSKELRAFGAWVCSGGLDEQYALVELAAVLERTEGQIQPDHRVIDALAAVSDEALLAALSCLEIIAMHEQPYWVFSMWMEAITTLLTRGRDGAATTRDKAREIAGRFLAQGVSGFEDIFERPAEG